MRIGTFLLEMIIVLAIIFCLYHAYFNSRKSAITNDNGELITKDVKGILNDVSTLSAVSAANSTGDKTKKDIEKKVNRLMKKYNIN